MKLKERDNRPKHQFKLGDMVELTPSKNVPSCGQGVVIEATAIDQNKPPRQRCKVIFAARDVDLYISVRSFITRRTLDPNSTVHGYEVMNTRLVYKGEAPEEWLKAISSREVSNIRFVSILDD